jgi:hypothetical protein
MIAQEIHIIISSSVTNKSVKSCCPSILSHGSSTSLQLGWHQLQPLLSPIQKLQ